MSRKSQQRQSKKRDRLNAGRVMAAARPRELSPAQQATLKEVRGVIHEIKLKIASAEAILRHRGLLAGLRPSA